LRHARYLDLPWAGHLPSLERPEVVTELLLAELGGGEPGEPGVPGAAGQPTS
jgi:hypothetical protein